MFDLGWSELLVIGIVALIVVGPKDLPGMFKQLGKFTARLRSMAREFSRAMEDAADASGAKDIAKDLRTMTNPKSMGVDALKKATNFDDMNPFGEDDDDESSQKPSKPKPNGTQNADLSPERAEAARKIQEHSAKRAQERLDREAAEADTSPPAPEPADSPESKA